MEEKKINIWSGYDFSESLKTSIFDLLKPQVKFLEQKTNSRLSMEYDYVDNSTIVYIIAYSLNNYRKKFLVIREEDNKKFPVNIYSQITDELFVDVKEDMFLDKIEEIINTPEVADSIKSLYEMATENILNNRR